MPYSTAVYVCAALILVSVGCGQSADPGANGALSNESQRATVVKDGVSSKSTRTDASANLELAIVQGLSNDRFEGEFQSELARVDPSQDGWESESFSERAQAQLDRLAKWISQGADGGTFPSDLVSDAISLSRLRPPGLTQIFSESNITVLRWEMPKGPAAEAPERLRGRSGLVQACQGMLIDKPQAIKTEFKIVRLQIDATEVLTEIHCHLSAHGAASRLQQNAIWLCRWQGNQHDQRPSISSLELVDFEEVRAERSSPFFVDCTESVFRDVSCFSQQLAHGLDYWRDRIDWRFGWAVVGAHGVAVGDVNGDGLDDLYVCETGGLPNRLLVQQADGTVRDISSAAGVDFLEPAQSALLLDLDNDGDQDLVVTSGIFVVFFENNGQARFTRRYVSQRRSMARSMAAADFDNNGLLDVFVCGYSSRDAHHDSVGLGRPLPYHDANNGGASYLLANQGDFGFEDVTEAVGLDVNNRRFSYAAAWEDYDNDGDMDLYVANDFGRNNLYRNDNGSFSDVAAEAGVEDVAAGMSVSWGDPNRDGLPDLYVGNMFSSAGNRIAYQRQFKASADGATRALYQRHARGNSLFENVGDGTFRDVSHDAAVTEARWAWSSNFIDINNDGWEDLVVANGMVTGSAESRDL